MAVPKAKLICSAICGHPQLGLRCFISITARIKSSVGPSGRASFLFWVKTADGSFAEPMPDGKFRKVDGFKAIAALRNRPGLIQGEQNPAISRSRARRFGARRRDRFRIKN